MKLRLEEKQQAQALRRKGYSYREIQSLLPTVRKSTLSYWLRDIVLTEDQKARLIEKMRVAGQAGRQLGALANQSARERRIVSACRLAEEQFPNLMKQPLFSVGLALYWAEGGKKMEMFHFINSDPEIIQLMILWLTGTCGIPRDQIRARVYAHEIYASESPELFWQEVTQLSQDQFRKTVYKPTAHTIKKNLDYKGCCRLDVSGVEFFWKIKTWQKLLFNYHLCSRGETDITTDFGSVIGGSSPSGSAI